MWSYSKPSKHRLKKNEMYRNAYYFENSTKGRIFSIGLPLFVVAAASTFGWYSSSASQANSVNVHHDTSSTTQSDSLKNPPDQSTSDVSTNLEFKQSTNPGSSAETELKVNSQPIDIPSNGTIHKVIQDNNGTTTVDVSVDSNTSGSSSSSTSTSVEVNSNSESKTNIEISGDDP